MNIIIYTDGSDFSRAAVAIGCEMVVRPEAASILVVSAYELVEPIDVIEAPAQFSVEIERSATEQSEAAAEEAATMIRERFADREIQITKQTSMGAPDQILIEAAKQFNADLIIIGPHGRGFWGRLLLGSITDSLVHNAPCSVLVVRKPADASPTYQTKGNAA
jgi:nucleotide-binding universal stress UspA family protein